MPGSQDLHTETQPKGTTFPLLILVLVAPFEPYPSLLATGPNATWMRHPASGVVVRTYSGLPLTPVRKQLSDLRDMVRSPGATFDSHENVDGSTSLLRLYGSISDIAHPKKTPEGRAGRILPWTASRSLLLASRSVEAWERHVLSPWKNRQKLRVTTSGTHLTVHHPSTMSNSLANQFGIIKHLAAGPRFAGVVFVTASAYVDQHRLAAWARQHTEGFVIGGSNALEDRGGMGRPFLSGFCQYFSWDAICTLAESTGLDHSTLNDESLTRWLVTRGITWVDPGIVWFTDELDAGRCPLCDHPEKSVVRCTSHGSRSREAVFMHQLDHQHTGDPAE